MSAYDNDKWKSSTSSTSLISRVLDGHCFVSLVLPHLPFTFILFYEPVDTRPRGMELKKDRAQEMRANHRTQNIYVTALVIEDMEGV